VESLLSRSDLILMEAAVVERLRRSGEVSLHERLVHAPLIYDEIGRRRLRGIYREYISVAERSRLPLLICTPTWRANRVRVFESDTEQTINEDAVKFMQETRRELSRRPDRVRIGGLIGCKNDCYRPSESLTENEAEQFHAWQIERLARSGCDFLMAATIPAVPEAVGIARAMARRGVPYLISFVIGRNGRILDGTDLGSAIAEIDHRTGGAPTGYMINCAHPSFLDPERLHLSAGGRLVGFQANASSLDHSELDGSSELMTSDIADWSDRMSTLHRRYGLKILGGCCGTSTRHLRSIAQGTEDASR
jgi:S-methylmethionine-dependent homocysteine/selenocysteine methylase